MTAERQTVTVEELGRIVGISRNAAYQAVRRGDVRGVRIGGRIVVPKAEIQRLLGPQQQTQPAA